MKNISKLTFLKKEMENYSIDLDIQNKLSKIAGGVPHYAIFTGPDKAGKLAAVQFFSKKIGKNVYRVDLSGVVSKYIGETEKNLDKIFNRAENKDWILFFDEADAIFGKRTNVKDAHDKYANIEISYLLQKIENLNRIVILSSNQIDDFSKEVKKRFKSVIHFPLSKV